MAQGLPPQNDKEREEEEREAQEARQMEERLDREERERQEQKRQRDEQERQWQREQDERFKNDPVRRALVEETHQRELRKHRNVAPMQHAARISIALARRDMGIPPKHGSPVTYNHRGSFAQAERKYGPGFMQMPMTQPLLEQEEESGSASGHGQEDAASLAPNLGRLKLEESGGTVPSRSQASRVYRYDEHGNLIQVPRPPVLEYARAAGPRVRYADKSEQERQEQWTRNRTRRLASGTTEPRTGVIEPRSRSSSASSSRSASPPPPPVPAPTSPSISRSRTQDFTPRTLLLRLPSYHRERSSPVANQSSSSDGTPALVPTGARPKTMIRRTTSRDQSPEHEEDRDSRSRRGSQGGQGQGRSGGHGGHRHHDHDPDSGCSIQ